MRSHRFSLLSGPSGSLAASIRDRRDRKRDRVLWSGVGSLIPTSRNNRPSNVLWQNHSTDRSLR